jgi:2-polyprenyl-3-methyl-5-hydroxy-6-metoxy-1,4-benzoquinol methylase
MNTAIEYDWPENLGREFHDLQELALNIDVQSGALLGSWGNLGYWLRPDGSTIQNYSEAAQQLAHQLAVFIQLQPSHHVLDVGFGCGDQLIYWQQAFGVNDIWGVNVSIIQTEYAQTKLNAFSCGATLYQGNACDHIIWDALPISFDRIVALDCVYHFSNRPDFYRLCASRLTSVNDGLNLNMHTCELVVSDLVLSRSSLGFFQRRILAVICKFSHIPFKNLKNLDDYERELNQSGLCLIESQDVSKAVMVPFSNWVLRYKKEIKALRQENKDASRLVNIAWGKYVGTALFLRWAVRYDIFQYTLMRIKKLEH